MAKAKPKSTRNVTLTVVVLSLVALTLFLFPIVRKFV
jgi:hypothetical protein